MPISDVLTEKVNRLLTLLTCYKLPNDDTLLEKLLNWIDGVVHRVVKCKDQNRDFAWQFLQATSAVEFLKTCSTMSDSNAELLTFALKLCGCVADVYFKELETDHTISALLQNATSDHWDHPSVRCALLQMLYRVWHNPTGRCWFTQKGCMSQVKKCLPDSSIFVVDAAVKLMSLCIIDLAKDEPSNMGQGTGTKMESNTQMDIENGAGQSLNLLEMLDFIMLPLHIDTSQVQGDVNVEQMTVPLQRSLVVLQDVCKDGQLARMLLCEHDLVGRLCNVLHLRTDCAKSYEAALDLISLLLNTGAVSEEDYSHLKKTTLHLAETDRFLSGLQLACSLLQGMSESNTPDPALTELLQSPLTVTVGLNQRHLNDALWEQMKCTLVDRRTHTQLLRESLTALRDLKVQQDCLPWLAALLTYSQKEADPGSSPLVTNMVGCSKIQQLTLDVLCQTLEDKNLEASKETTLQIFHCCITFLRSSLTSAAICGKAFHCLCMVLKDLSHLGLLNPTVDASKEEAGSVLDLLQSTLQRSLCDVKWETRDSAVEFVGSLVSKMQDGSDVIVEWVIDSGVVMGVWQCVMDGESYVRAAALTSLGCLSEVSRVWQHVTVTVGQSDIIEKITEVIQNDTEAFARRAAVDLLVKLWTNDLIDPARSHDIEKVMQNAMHDFDWEVKLRVLSFWERVLEKLGAEPVQHDHDVQPIERDDVKRGRDDATTILQSLCDSGGLIVLLDAFDDYDKAVQKKACVMLKTLKVKYAVNENGPIPKMAKFSITGDTDMSFQEMVSPPGHNTVGVSSQDSDTSKNGETSCVDDYMISKTTKKGAGQDISEFILWISKVDLDSVCVTVDQSTDEYADNPESLVDDLLTSLERIEHMTDTEGEESGEENVIDCY